MLGLPADPARVRIERLDEACQVLKLLRTEEATDFAGRHYRLDQALADPKPVQRPHRRSGSAVAVSGTACGSWPRHADGWMNACMNHGDVAEPTRLSRVLDRHCEQVGRDPATIRRAVQFPLPDEADETLRMVERYAEAGFHDILFMPFHGGLGRVDATAALLPQLRSIS